jgi:NADP-dependent 3-hydroxy acid dehydrogenase YdfG
MNSPTKRIAWITGGGTGIGLAGAISLSKEGWQVVISGRRSDVLSRAADAIRSQGGAVDQIVLDVENVEQVNDTAAQILKKHNRIDLLINSAGLNVPNRSWENVTIDGWNSVVNINLNGLVYCIKAVLPAMIDQRDGCISSHRGREGTSLNSSDPPTLPRKPAWSHSRSLLTSNNTSTVFGLAPYAPVRSRPTL